MPSTLTAQPSQPATTTTVASSTTVEAQPKTLEAAVAAAQEKADRHAAGDFAGEWLLFTKSLRDHISQQTFVDYSEACSPTGIKITVSGGRMDGTDHAALRQEALGVVLPVPMTYENDGWYKIPDDFLTSNYGKTAADMIAADKAQGGCAKQ
jgi:hypothetical protein